MTFKYNPLIGDGFCYFEKTFQGVSASAPSGPVEGWTYINSGDNGYYIYYGGTWQLLHTLTAAGLSFLLQENGDFILQEDGSSKIAQEA